MALDLPLPTLVFANGWITMEGVKMSKSLGNVIRPADLIERFSVDSTRYVLFAQAPYGTDFSFSEESLLRRHNAELANDLGNLVQRSLSMLARYREGVVPPPAMESAHAAPFERARVKTAAALEALDFREALAVIWERVGAMNLHVEQTKPWELNKRGDAAALDAALYELCEGLRFIGALVYPFMPATGATIWRSLGQSGTPGAMWEKTLRWGGLSGGTRTAVPPALFPRVEAVAP
jgi:methionyl-tRNA synthetase